MISGWREGNKDIDKVTEGWVKDSLDRVRGTLVTTTLTGKEESIS